MLIHPFMHTTSKEIRKQLGLWYTDVVWEDAFTFEMMYQEQVKKGEAIFPRIDIEKELAALHEISAALKAAKEPADAAEANVPLTLKPEIEYDDFDKIDFRDRKGREASEGGQAAGIPGKDGNGAPPDHQRCGAELQAGGNGRQEGHRSRESQTASAARHGVQGHDFVCGQR